LQVDHILKGKEALAPVRWVVQVLQGIQGVDSEGREDLPGLVAETGIGYTFSFLGSEYGGSFLSPTSSILQ
jgi:hypothetical protein